MYYTHRVQVSFKDHFYGGGGVIFAQKFADLMILGLFL